MPRTACVGVVFALWFGVGLSAQQNESPIRASLEREAMRLGATLVARDQSLADTPGINTAATQSGRSDDWEAVRRLGGGTRVIVTTSALIGKASACDDCELRFLPIVVGTVVGSSGGGIFGYLIGHAEDSRSSRVVYGLAKP